MSVEMAIESLRCALDLREEALDSD